MFGTFSKHVNIANPRSHFPSISSWEVPVRILSVCDFAPIFRGKIAVGFQGINQPNMFIAISSEGCCWNPKALRDGV